MMGPKDALVAIFYASMVLVSTIKPFSGQFLNRLTIIALGLACLACLALYNRLAIGSAFPGGEPNNALVDVERAEGKRRSWVFLTIAVAFILATMTVMLVFT